VFKNHYIYKWFDVNAVTNTAKSDLNYTIYRLADVMLMYAEASNRAEGSPNANALLMLTISVQGLTWPQLVHYHKMRLSRKYGCNVILSFVLKTKCGLICCAPAKYIMMLPVTGIIL
jgi:hypothetical protein